MLTFVIYLVLYIIPAIAIQVLYVEPRLENVLVHKFDRLIMRAHAPVYALLFLLVIPYTPYEYVRMLVLAVGLLYSATVLLVLLARVAYYKKHGLSVKSTHWPLGVLVNSVVLLGSCLVLLDIGMGQ